ncbi:PIG-L deacetylase family protein [Auraticoccus cholistanensis]|nr:PIG-L family deacetylase [Auraticoccus cholistanensis]
MESEPRPFPEDWQRAAVVVAHPDDVEYGLAAAVARWTRSGRSVSYVLASSGEAGIQGMAPEVAGPLREEEQRRSSAVVGVHDLHFLGFPDSALRNEVGLRSAVLEAVERIAPDVVVVGYYGPAWGPGEPNQSDHVELGHAVAEALAVSGLPLYEQDLAGELVVDVEDHVEAAVAALAEHRVYLEVLDPTTPVLEQARVQVERSCPPEQVLGGRRGVRLSRVAD